jgi:hypothetical protein
MRDRNKRESGGHHEFQAGSCWYGVTPPGRRRGYDLYSSIRQLAEMATLLKSHNLPKFNQMDSLDRSIAIEEIEFVIQTSSENEISRLWGFTKNSTK